MTIETKCEIGKYYYFIDMSKNELMHGMCIAIHPCISYYTERKTLNVFETENGMEGAYDDAVFENLAQSCLHVKKMKEDGTVH